MCRAHPDPSPFRPSTCAGATGATGGVGPQGPQGDLGQTGLTGEKGMRGEVGPNGELGIMGVIGQKGQQGLRGVSATDSALVSWNECAWYALNNGADYGLLTVSRYCRHIVGMLLLLVQFF